jgi:hypothetical protein
LGFGILPSKPAKYPDRQVDRANVRPGLAKSRYVVSMTLISLGITILYVTKSSLDYNGQVNWEKKLNAHR